MTASPTQPNPLEVLSSAARGAAEAITTALARLPPLPAFPGTPRRPSSPSAAAAAAAAAAPTLRAAPAAPSSPPSFPGARRSQQHLQRVSKDELGRATWTLLHSVAAALPAAPSRLQRRAFCQLVHSLAELYPCAECADHFGKIVDARPPERAVAAEGGGGARQWCCEAHNDVNERAGKPRFDCSLAAARWAGLDCDGDGSSSCELAGPGAAPRRGR
jgi:mitochondrial FAD-linked sulfhydryl oxidase